MTLQLNGNITDSELSSEQLKQLEELQHYTQKLQSIQRRMAKAFSKVQHLKVQAQEIREFREREAESVLASNRIPAKTAASPASAMAPTWSSAALPSRRPGTLPVDEKRSEQALGTMSGGSTPLSQTETTVSHDGNSDSGKNSVHPGHLDTTRQPASQGIQSVKARPRRKVKKAVIE
ncbi:hypothetical protein EV182_000161 [Spiromyces aspiralis]|uniref:Uncharacterized protein n=1 Tax=Spiromyces aspiralis TaxID=68401 RepID=A0ACC1HJZ3_9FUNG|nr:hypothetical protein EV182_000161 [Spiromyces aspiralis]